MTTLEQVEKLRERANVSFEEAKQALEESGGDLLDALILLERQGKTDSPPAGGYYSGESSTEEEPESAGPAHGRKKSEGSFQNSMRALGRMCAKLFNAGNVNHIDALKNDKVVLSCPVTVFVILIIAAFWVVIPLIIIGLFFGWRYRLRGPNLGKDSINDVIASAEDAVEDLKNTVAQSANNAKAAHEKKDSKQEAGADEDTDGPEAL